MKKKGANLRLICKQLLHKFGIRSSNEYTHGGRKIHVHFQWIASHSFYNSLALYFYPNKTRESRFHKNWNVKRTTFIVSTFSSPFAISRPILGAISRLNESFFLFLPSNDRQKLILESVQRVINYLPSQKRKVVDWYFPLAFYPLLDPGEKKKKKQNSNSVPPRISTHFSIRLIRDFFFLSVLTLRN